MNRQQPFISSMFESQTSDLRACSCPESLHRSWESSCSLLLASELSPVPLAEIGGFPVFDGPCHPDRPFSYRPRIPFDKAARPAVCALFPAAFRPVMFNKT